MTDNAEHVRVLQEMFTVCANERRMMEAYALDAAILALSPAAAGDPIADLAAQQEPGLPCSSEMMLEMLEPQGVVGDGRLSISDVKDVVAKYVGRTSRIYLYIANDLAKLHHAAFHPPAREGQPDGR